MKNKGKKWLSLITSIVIMAQLCLTVLPVAVKAETTSIFTDYLPTITEITDEAGFTHPGVGLTKELLENVRTKVRAGAEPWNYYFNSMLVPSSDAARSITSSNSSDGINPSINYLDSQGANSKFIADSIKAYSQAVMYLITGDEVYRKNGMMIIRIWEKMDPTKFVYFTDSHIHTGVPLNRMVMAAEILRYTSSQSELLAWTDKDTADFTNNLITPVIKTYMSSPDRFMNQHNYPLMGAMAGYIFSGNKEGYDKSVEWFTVNATAKDQGFNGSVKQLFRWVTEEQKPGTIVGEGTPVEPHVQHMEMGRDQAHGGGDLTNAAIITRMIKSQGTKVDPVAGTPSTADNAVGPMEFLNDRLIAAADYFWQFMLGYDTPWTPQAYAITGGDPNNGGMGGYIRDTYNVLSEGYRGRFSTANFWDFYSYYTYVRHEDVAQLAPHYYEAFTKKLVPTPDGWRNKDAGNDFWLYLPPEAEADAAKFIPQDKSSGKILELEDRYTKLDNNTATMQEGDTTFIRFHATEAGSEIAVLSFGYAGSGPHGFKIRTNGVTQFDALNSSFTLPDTKGEWKYVSLSGYFGDLVNMTVRGAPGVTVDIDHVNADPSALTPPVFKAESSNLKIYTYVGASVNVDFSATDASSTDVITYELQNNPKGLPINNSTGAFSWQPTEAGNISVVVTATDGTTVAVKNVNLIVSSDRASAVQAITAGYDANQIYEKASLAQYQTAYQDTMSQIDTASNEDFDKLLQTLRNATESLRLLTPLTPLGSMYWSKVAHWSSWGKDAAGLDDASWGGGWFGLALGSPPHLHHIIDFGPDYKISAYRFGFKSSIFADRVANSTVYASNDKMNWTRITPGVAAYTQEYNTIDVDPVYQNEKYRYIKLEMVKPLPDVLYGQVRNLFEPRGFTIYGTRYDVGNKLQSVSLSSDKSMLNRVALGSTVKASITAKEAIQNVKVKIQGLDATVSTQDNINWTAAAVLTEKDQTGDVNVSVDYQRQDGTNGDTLYGTTDNTKLFVVDDSDLINNVTGITNLIDSTSGRSAATTLQIVNSLFDNNASTGSDFRYGSSGWGGYITFDFKEGNAVTLSSVELLANQTFYTRLGGTVVQGSNDNATWTTLTNGANGIANWQSFAVSDTTPYRYIRIFNGGNWVGNMAEVKFHGAVKHFTKIASASISSAQSIVNRIVPGNTAQLSFTTTEPVSNVNVMIQGQAATVSSPDNINWTATATLNQGVATGPVKFTINYNNQDGTAGYPATQTTDNTSLFLVDESDVIKNVTSMTNLIDSTSGRSAATTLQIVNSLFDNNASTGSDFRNGSSSGWGSYITFDFKEGNKAALSSVEVLARPTLTSRINGTVVQGSDDNSTWTTISNTAFSTPDWQTLTINNEVSYRYIRIFNGGNWYGNMAEVKFHGQVEVLNRIESASISSAQSLKTRIVSGNTVKLSFKAKEAINNVNVKIQGQDATVSSADNINWTATATLNQGVAAGNVTFAVNYKTQSGVDGYPATSTTDGSKLYIADESDLIQNVTSIANLIDSTSGRSAASTLSITNNLFDSNIASATDYRLNGTGSGSYITFDFKEGNQAALSSVELLARQDQIGRIKNTVIQGSNDNTTWTDLTTAAVASGDWQSLSVSSKVPYRYIRVWNWSAWYGNMAELRLHGVVKAADVTSPVTTDNAPQGSVNNNTTVSLNAVDESSGVAATYFKVDGGAQQTGNTIALTTDGTHTIVYWSVDFAGNVEQQHTVTVNITDNTPPVVAGLYADITVPTNKDVHVTIYYPLDAAVMEYKVGDTGVWTEYTAPVTVSDNVTVYARSADAAGNVSDVASYTVSNIYKTAPSDAILTADITDPTNGKVTLTISYPDNVTVKEYKVGENGTWTAYASPVTLSDNVTVYAQSKDFVGNVSNVTHYTVSNIDRMPPSDAVLSPDITAPTNQDVTVTVTYPDDVAVKEYKVGDNGVWTAYGAPVVISDNSTVYAKGTDAAGNVSKVTQYAVGNIDRVAPTEAILAVDTTAPTNQGVTVMATYPDDAAVKEYKVGESGPWTAYTDPVVVEDNDTVYARGIDAVGNVSNVTSMIVSNIYKIAPITTATLNPATPNGKNSWYTTDVTVSLSANASVNGGAVTTEYQVNDGDWTVYTGSMPAFGDGAYKVGYRSKDEAGNVEQLKTIEFKVDKTAPVLSVQLDKTSIWPPNHMMVPINATLLSTDDGSGVESVVLTSITSNQPDSGNGDILANFGTAATSFSVRAEKGSIYTITYTATDKAGNKTPVSVTVTVPHDQSGI